MGEVILYVNLAVFFGIIAGILLHRIIGAYVEGSVSSLECVLISGLYLGFIFSVVTTQFKLAAAALALLFLIYLLPRHRERSIDRAFREEQIQGFREAIAADPRNLAARSRLVDVLYKMGRLDEAIDEQTQLVQLAPNDPAESHRLQQLLRDKQELSEPFITCRTCGHKNPSGRTRCEECENALTSSSLLLKKRPRDLSATKLATGAGVLVGAVTILFGLSLLPLSVRIIVVASILLLVIITVLVNAYLRY